jgi:V/A-type H+-transporting ATPase subunit C
VLELFGPSSALFWILIFSLTGVTVGFASRPFLTYAKFAYPNALFEAIGNPYITDKELNTIIDSKDINSFKETVNASKNYDLEGEDVQTIQNALDDNFIKTIEMMRKASSKKMKTFYDMYLEKIDMYLIKNVLKKIILRTGRDVEVDTAILPSTKELLSNLKNASTETIPDLLVSYGFEKEIIEYLSEAHPDIMLLDVLIDRFIINKFTESQIPYRCEEAKESFIKRSIDIMNLKNLLRAKQLKYDVPTSKALFLGEGSEIAAWKFSELAEVDHVSQVISSIEGTSYFNILKDTIEVYTKEESVQVLENALDRLFLKLVKDISLQHVLNLGPTIRFLISKEFEIQNLKVIVKGIGEQLSSDFLKNLVITEVT